MAGTMTVVTREPTTASQPLSAISAPERAALDQNSATAKPTAVAVDTDRRKSSLSRALPRALTCGVRAVPSPEVSVGVMGTRLPCYVW